PPPACGDLARFWSDLDGTAPVMQFRPGIESAPDPSPREIGAMTVSAAAESVPRTELRISAGKEDSSDVSARVSVGWRTAGKWASVLLMNGRRGIQIPVKD